MAAAAAARAEAKAASRASAAKAATAAVSVSASASCRDTLKPLNRPAKKAKGAARPSASINTSSSHDVDSGALRENYLDDENSGLRLSTLQLQQPLAPVHSAQVAANQMHPDSSDALYATATARGAGVKRGRGRGRGRSRGRATRRATNEKGGAALSRVRKRITSSERSKRKQTTGSNSGSSSDDGAVGGSNTSSRIIQWPQGSAPLLRVVGGRIVVDDRSDTDRTETDQSQDEHEETKHRDGGEEDEAVDEPGLLSPSARAREQEMGEHRGTEFNARHEHPASISGRADSTSPIVKLLLGSGDGDDGHVNREGAREGDVQAKQPLGGAHRQLSDPDDPIPLSPSSTSAAHATHRDEAMAQPVAAEMQDTDSGSPAGSITQSLPSTSVSTSSKRPAEATEAVEPKRPKTLGGDSVHAASADSSAEAASPAGASAASPLLYISETPVQRQVSTYATSTCSANVQENEETANDSEGEPSAARSSTAVTRTPPVVEPSPPPHDGKGQSAALSAETSSTAAHSNTTMIGSTVQLKVLGNATATVALNREVAAAAAAAGLAGAHSAPVVDNR
jgi:hypothetical protein